MIVKIQRRTTPFALVNKAALEDTRLSWKAKGILAYLLSRPESWEVISGDVINRSTDGRESVLAGMNELKQFGYAKLDNDRDEKGHVMGKHWVVFEEPETPPINGFPEDRVSRRSDKPKIGKSTTSNKEESSNKEEDSKKNTSKDREEVLALTEKLRAAGHGDLWDGYLQGRLSKKAKNTDLSLVLVLRELFKHPGHIRKGLEKAVKSTWVGFDWEWVDKSLKKSKENGSGEREVWVPVETPDYPTLEELATRHLQ
jgi:hypothetical protein